MLKADKKLLKQNAESLSELTRTQKESWDAQAKEEYEPIVYR
ncbi:20528_t:CDS:2 [Rhizophagus irregularis]|nr:20528_t:CDS:2 [Rhizophagus irregularis]